MPFSYFADLNPVQQAIYLLSDQMPSPRVQEPEAIWPLVIALERALKAGKRKDIEVVTSVLCDALTDAVGAVRVRLRVLAVRPSNEEAELHGLYTWHKRRMPTIQVWMRTAKKARVVAFRSYLRTVLHELCHHLDVTLLELPESFHTQGFFRRESSLFHQIVPPELKRPRSSRA